ncbi:MAG: alkaline phosphatase family protein [Firmicutes bacterium]|nr:alkaline phosphatase family protein [Bacillota bacterium]
MKKNVRTIWSVAIVLLMAAVLSMAMPVLGEPAFAQESGTHPAALDVNAMSIGDTPATAKKENPMIVGEKSATAKIKKKVTFKKAKVFNIQNARGKVTFKIINGNSKITISRAGNVTVKKGLKKGRTYTVNVKIRAGGTKNFAAKTVMARMKVTATARKVKVETAGPKNTGDDGTGITHVVILGIDGAGRFFQDLDMPNLKRAKDKGAFTFNCLTSDPTLSAQCWGSMLHGVEPDYHMLTNESVASTTYPLDSPYPSVFRVIRENMPDAELASFCNWNPINTGIIEEGIDVRKETAGDAELTEMVCGYLEQNDPTLLFVQFDSVDAAGHQYGYASWDFMLTLAMMDENIGKIYNALDQRGLLDSTLFIVTADHGGTLEGTHGGWTDEEKYVMFMASGPGVVVGEFEFMEIRDVPAIVLYALGLSDKQPAGWTSYIPAGLFQSMEGGNRP